MCLFLLGSLLGVAAGRPPWAHAQESEQPSLPVVVRIARSGDRMLLERVRGQTNDLDVTLSDDESPLEAGLGAQLDRARALANERGARVVVWFLREEPTLTVFVAEPAAGRVLVRRLERSADKMGASAQNEAAALVVRSAMRALAQGGEIGVAEREVAPAAPEPVPAPAPEPAPAPAPVLPAPEPAPLPEAWELSQFLGARSAADGASDAGQHALFAGLVLRYRSFQTELRGFVGLPTQVDDSVARVQLVRHGGSIHFGILPIASERWALSAAFGGGVNVFLSDVDGRRSAFEAQDRALVISAVSADATVRFMPYWARGRFGFALMAGADLLPLAPNVGYWEGEQFVKRERVWNLIPTAALELVVRIR